MLRHGGSTQQVNRSPVGERTNVGSVRLSESLDTPLVDSPVRVFSILQTIWCRPRALGVSPGIAESRRIRGPAKEIPALTGRGYDGPAPFL